METTFIEKKNKRIHRHLGTIVLVDYYEAVA